MFHENEIVMLFLCTGVLIFTRLNRKNLAKFKGWVNLFTSFILLFVAYISTIVEGFLLEEFFNYIEHTCYAVSGIVLTVWCYKAFQRYSE